MVKMNIAEIEIGERDRTDSGDLAGLVESIRGVGLLHPVVVTADGNLVAGGRRLDAARQLGWHEIPVTVVDLESAADVLRAELDENTCRKPLTPYEASRARERRATVLAPPAAAAKGHGQTAPGKSKPNASGNFPEALAEGRRTRNVAAIGTGYSGKTLDKVDRIRDAAERGVAKRGDQEVPVPESVREVARGALVDVSRTGAAVDNAYQRVNRALDEYIEDDASVQNAKYMKSFWQTLKALGPVQQFDLSRATAAFSREDWENADLVIAGMERWIAQYHSIRPGKLRVMSGGLL